MKILILVSALLFYPFNSFTNYRQQLSGFDQVKINKELLLKLINEVRQKGCTCGSVTYSSASPLQWNEQLEKAAFKHCMDMNNNKYLSHIGTDGSGVGERMEKEGYQWTNYAENIGMGYLTEQEVINGWLHSEGHCKNLMNKTYKEIGASRVGQYWTLDFGAR